ncbi:MAG: response regulator, partial [Pseudomonadota bacterium]|nr:response regulator [Pseudomonadota bacterium]
MDDQHAMRTLTRRSLQHLGFDEIYDLADPLEAIQIARDKRIHLIISDYNMSNMNGFEFLNAVRSDPVIGKVAFIMLSGASDRETVEKAAA